MQFLNTLLLAFALTGAALAVPSPAVLGGASSYSGGPCQVYNDGQDNYSSLSKCVTKNLGVGSCCWDSPKVGDYKPHTYTG